mmetsp:Transcript_29215/g.54142  ORF Transcript_29215/g.54142 Transcript_29215/m.54142 type:complete len:208 (+) Transcript_29215:575-1198(+)
MRGSARPTRVCAIPVNEGLRVATAASRAFVSFLSCFLCTYFYDTPPPTLRCLPHPLSSDQHMAHHRHHLLHRAIRHRRPRLHGRLLPGLHLRLLRRLSGPARHDHLLDRGHSEHRRLVLRDRRQQHGEQRQRRRSGRRLRVGVLALHRHGNDPRSDLRHADELGVGRFHHQEVLPLRLLLLQKRRRLIQWYSTDLRCTHIGSLGGVS